MTGVESFVLILASIAGSAATVLMSWWLTRQLNTERRARQTKCVFCTKKVTEPQACCAECFRQFITEGITANAATEREKKKGGKRA